MILDVKYFRLPEQKLLSKTRPFTTEFVVAKNTMRMALLFQMIRGIFNEKQSAGKEEQRNSIGTAMLLWMLCAREQNSDQNRNKLNGATKVKSDVCSHNTISIVHLYKA